MSFARGLDAPLRRPVAAEVHRAARGNAPGAAPPVRNLFTQTESLSDAAWTAYHSTLTLDPNEVAPGGTKTAWRLTKVGTDTTPAGFYRMVDGADTTRPRTLSLKAKAATHRYIEFTLFDNDTEFGIPMLVVRFDLQTGEWVPLGDGTEYVVSYDPDSGDVVYAAAGTGAWTINSYPLENGWHTFCATIAQEAAHTYEIDVVAYTDLADDAIEAAGNYVLICQPQYEDGTSASAYQAVGA